MAYSNEKNGKDAIFNDQDRNYVYQFSQIHRNKLSNLASIIVEAVRVASGQWEGTLDCTEAMGAVGFDTSNGQRYIYVFGEVTEKMVSLSGIWWIHLMKLYQCRNFASSIGFPPHDTKSIILGWIEQYFSNSTNFTINRRNASVQRGDKSDFVLRFSSTDINGKILYGLNLLFTNLFSKNIVTMANCNAYLLQNGMITINQTIGKSFHDFTEDIGYWCVGCGELNPLHYRKFGRNKQKCPKTLIQTNDKKYDYDQQLIADGVPLHNRKKALKSIIYDPCYVCFGDVSLMIEHFHVLYPDRIPDIIDGSKNQKDDLRRPTVATVEAAQSYRQLALWAEKDVQGYTHDQLLQIPNEEWFFPTYGYMRQAEVITAYGIVPDPNVIGGYKLNMGKLKQWKDPSLDFKDIELFFDEQYKNNIIVSPLGMGNTSYSQDNNGIMVIDSSKSSFIKASRYKQDKDKDEQKQDEQKQN